MRYAPTLSSGDILVCAQFCRISESIHEVARFYFYARSSSDNEYLRPAYAYGTHEHLF